MKPQRKTGQRLAAATLAAALLVPASAFAEKRPAPGTERARTAAQVIESILQKHEEKQKQRKKPTPAAKRRSTGKKGAKASSVARPGRVPGSPVVGEALRSARS